MLRIYDFPDQLPLGTEELLRVLDAAVPREILRPGDNVEEALYNSGARDLVDFLLDRLEAPAEDESPPEEHAWYDHDSTTKDYIEGSW